jgi:hypothetical protein
MVRSVRCYAGLRGFVLATALLATCFVAIPATLWADPPVKAEPASTQPAPTAEKTPPVVASSTDSVAPLSLKYFPADAVALFALRPIGFFGRDQLKVLDRLLNINGSDFRNPIPVTKIEQLTMIMVRPDPERPAPENGQQLIFDLVHVRTTEPVDWDKKRAAFPYEMQAVEHAGKRYFKIPEQPNICFFPADDRNYLVGDEWNLKHVVEQSPGDPAKLAWGDVWSQVENSSLVFAFEPTFAAKSMKEVREIPGFEQLLKDSKALAATLDGGVGMRWRILIDCPDEKIADVKVQGAKALIAVARLGVKTKPKPDPGPDGKVPPPTVNDLTSQLLGSAEFAQVGRTAVVNMRTEAEVGMAMQVVTNAVGAFFGSKVAGNSGQFRFADAAPAAPTAVPGGVINSPAMVKRRGLSKQNLERVAAALLKYQERVKTLPARGNVSADGKPLLSWRVHVLPDLGYEELYREFHLDEPWDSEHNAKLVAKMPREYGGSLAADAKPANGNSMVLAVVGPTTCFPEQGTKSLSEITDGPATTLLVTETRRNLPWTKPDDLMADATGKPSGKLGGVHPGGVIFCTADGKAHFVRDAVLVTLTPALFTIAGQEPLDAARLDGE